MDPQSTDLPEPLDGYCTLLDPAFHRSEQKKAFRTYLQGLLLSAERNTTATYMANTEPGKSGSKHKAAQQIQWFLSESSWLPEDLHQARRAVMENLDGLHNDEPAVLIIDETGDRKYGTHTAHVGRQYLGSTLKSRLWRGQRALALCQREHLLPAGPRPLHPSIPFQESRA